MDKLQAGAFASLSLVLVIFLHAGVREQDSSQIPAEARKTLAVILGSQGLARGELSPLVSARQGPADSVDYTWVILNPKTQANMGICMVGCLQGRLTSISWRIRRREPGKAEYTAPEEAWQVAVRYAKPVLEHVFGAKAASLVFTKSARPSPETDGYGFHWKVRPPPDSRGSLLYVEVSAFTGDVTSVWLLLRPPEPDAEQMAQLRAEAVAQLAARLKREGLPPFKDSNLMGEFHAWHLLPEGRQYCWQPTFTLEPVVGKEGDEAIRVLNSMVYPRGEGVVELEIEELPAEQVRLAKREHISLYEAGQRLHPQPEWVVGDQDPQPLLSGGAIAFLSTRHVAGYPTWRELARYVCIASPTGSAPTAFCFVKYLPCMCLATSREGRWLCYRYRDKLSLYDVMSGATYYADRQHGALPAPIFMASTKPWVLGPVDTRSAKTQWMLFTAAQGGGPRLTSSPVSGLRADDVAVYFNSDDHAAAIVNEVLRPSGPGCSVYVAQVDGECKFSNRTKLIEGMWYQPAVSWLSDGKRLLLHAQETVVFEDPGPPPRAEDNIQIVDSVTGARTPFRLPPLRDPQTGEELVLEWGSVRVLRGDELVLAARSQAWPPERGARLYVCKLDGTQLRRITPLEDPPIEAYVLPHSGKPVFDLAAEIAR